MGLQFIRTKALTGSLSTFPKFTLIVGGARSGKSRLAERLAHATGLPRSYVATSEVWDDEMQARITRHIADRGPDWTTFETPRDVAGALAQAKGMVLIDCATLWLTNVMLGGGDIEGETQTLLAAIAAYPDPVIVVSNEVGWGIVPDNALARQFRDEQGRLNQRVAAKADLAVAVLCGLPLALKGALP